MSTVIIITPPPKNNSTTDSNVEPQIMITGKYITKNQVAEILEEAAKSLRGE